MPGGSIPLSKKHGVNPHLTVCPRCGRDADELILTGAHHKYRCDSCGMLHVGRPQDGHCQNPECHANTSGLHTLVDEGELDPSEKLRATQPCATCREELEKFKAVIDAGGVPFRCKDCKVQGVLQAESELAKAVRAKHGGQTVGVEFDKTTCPKCGPDPVV